MATKIYSDKKLQILIKQDEKIANSAKKVHKRKHTAHKMTVIAKSI